MSKPLVSIKPGSTLSAAVKLMDKKNIGVVVIVDGQEATGILTERDILRAVAKDEDLKVTTVEAYMTRQPKTIEHDASVLDATKVMSKNNFRRLIVKKGDKLAGMITAKDVVKLMSNG